MAALRYTINTSLDGFIADAHVSIEWTEPDPEVFAFITDQEQAVGTYLYGRRLYDAMVYWETAGTEDDEAAPPKFRDFAHMWRAADKVVYSRAGRAVESARTRVLSRFDPDEVRAMKASAEHDLTVGGADLAGQALLAGLVDECHLYVVPVMVGGGTRALPEGLRTSLTLVDEHRFPGGVVHLHYRIT